MSTVCQAYRFALDPTPTQIRALTSHAGAARFAYNWALAAVRAVMAQRRAERTYGMAEAELTPAVSWTLPGLRRRWNQAKDEVAPWWPNCSKEAYNTGLEALARGLANWTDSRSGKRAGRPLGFPRFKSKRRAPLTCRFTTGAIRVEADRHHITLPRLGTIKTHESTRKLARRLEASTARILSATIKNQGRRWFCSFTCEVQRADGAPARPHEAVGVDVGIKNLAVLSIPVAGVSDGYGAVANPRHLATALSSLRRTSRRVSRRRGPDRRIGQNPSHRWQRASQERSRIHHRVANLRRDGLHKLTTALATTFGTIVIEDLNLTGMVRNRRLARHIVDAAFGEIGRQLTYKTTWRGGRLMLADRWYPSSKTCSACGVVKSKLPLSVRTFHCTTCGLTLDRDVNAARNLAALAGGSSTGTGVAGDLTPSSVNGRGADQKTRRRWAGGNEASTPHRERG